MVTVVPMQTEPRRDLGFYAMVPRVVRTGYRTLSPATKWLYVCLKDLCGDAGTCYRALKTLAVETGLSTGAISTMIRRLHLAGLIHATKKRRGSDTGHEVWHISIVDIWGANEHCSRRERGDPPPDDSGQNRSRGEASGEESGQNRSPRERIVHEVNDKAPDRSPREADRSPIDAKEEPSEEEPSLKKNREEDWAPGGAGVSSSSSFQKEREDDSSSPTWSVPAILNIAAYSLPPLPSHVSRKQQQANDAEWIQAATHMHEDSLFAALPDDSARIEVLARMLSFVTHPLSPSWWVTHFVVRNGADKLRLWHISNSLRGIVADMEAHFWFGPPVPRPSDDEPTVWRQSVPAQPPDRVDAAVATRRPSRRTEQDTDDQDQEPTVTPDIDSPAPAYESPDPEDQELAGMSYATAARLREQIGRERPAFCAQIRAISGGGFMIEVATSPQQSYLLPAPAAWNALLGDLAAAYVPLRERLAARRRAEHQREAV